MEYDTPTDILLKKGAKPDRVISSRSKIPRYCPFSAWSDEVDGVMLAECELDDRLRVNPGTPCTWDQWEECIYHRKLT
jgi:hypothetical protein